MDGALIAAISLLGTAITGLTGVLWKMTRTQNSNHNGQSEYRKDVLGTLKAIERTSEAQHHSIEQLTQLQKGWQDKVEGWWLKPMNDVLTILKDRGREGKER